MFISPKNLKKPKKQTKTPQIHKFGAGKESYINLKKKKGFSISYQKKGWGSISMVLKFESTFGIPEGLLKEHPGSYPPSF